MNVQHKTPPPRREKPDSSAFLTTLDASLNDPGTDVRRIYRLLAMGIDGQLQDSFMDEVAKRLLPWKDSCLLAMRLAVEVAAGKPSKLLRGINFRIHTAMLRRSRFPRDVPESTNAFQQERQDRLLQWVSEESENQQQRIEWARCALAALVSPDMIPEDFEVIHCIVSRCRPALGRGETERSGSPARRYRKYLRKLDAVFSKEELRDSALELGLEMVQVFEGRLKNMQETLRRDERALCEREQQLAAMRSAEEVLRASQRESTEAMKRLSEELTACQREREEGDRAARLALAREKERYEALESHWKREVKAQAQKMRRDMEHELDAGRRALDSSSPNVRLALESIRRLGEYVKRLGGEDNG